MKTSRLLALLVLLPAAGCIRDNPPAPEELALEGFDAAKKQFEEGDYRGAAEQFQFDIQSRPRWKEPYVLLAACHEKLHREPDAIAVLEQLLHVDGTDEDALRGLGRIYAGRGDAERALGYYRKLRTVRPEDRSLDSEIARLEAMRKP